MKLKTAELKKFKEYARLIPPNQLLPICNYLHFKLGSVTKNSMNSFVTMEIDSTEEMLIDERILMSFVAQTQADEIDVKVKGTQVVISDGMKDHSPTVDPITFPINEVPQDEEWVELANTVLYDINTAASLIIEDQNMPARSHVFIGNGMIAGGDGVTVYSSKYDGLKGVILSKQAASIMGKFEEGDFCHTENYQYFRTGGLLFGFIKPALGMMDMRPFFKNLSSNQFTIDKSFLISFNDHVIQTASPTSDMTAALQVENGKLYLDMNDTAFNRTITKQIECEGKCGEFSFVTTAMQKLLKTLPDQELTFIESTNKLYITGETGFISLIMRVKK